MFYMHFLVNKRGPLAKIWLAAHWEKKLTKAHIFECNLETTVEKIISPKFTIALRTSGHLLLGVVRIYHRKAKYLLADCSEALTKMKAAFRPGLVDLPAEILEAAYQSITLPEEFNDFATPLPDLNAIEVAEHFTLNQSRAEDITLTEDYESNILLCDRNFGERNEEPDTLRKQSFFDGGIFTSSNSLVADQNSASMNGDKATPHDNTYCLEHDGFGDEENAADMIEILLRDEQNGLDKDTLDMEEECPLSQDLPENSTAGDCLLGFPIVESNSADATLKKVSHLTSETILLLKEEGFVLEPVDETAVTQRKKNKRKRKLIVDGEKELSCNAIYNQLNNCTDILAMLDLAPPTKKTMMWKQWGGVDKLLSHAAQPVIHTELQKLFARCFKSHRSEMRRNGSQRQSEIEETRKEQETTEPSSSYLETERKAGNDSFMLISQDNRNKTDNCGETIVSAFRSLKLKKNDKIGLNGSRKCRVCAQTGSIHWDGRAFSESSSLANNSLGNEAETQQVELTNVGVLRAGLGQSCALLRSIQIETGKESEEIRWSKRTLQLLKTLQVLHLKRSGLRSFSLQQLCRKNNRKEAAAKFYVFLVLKKQSVIELAQSSPFADITATAGPKFNIC
ncbi:RD21L protein, partial [Crotophaga sulcirostris]|nr:RD21L protein [Crotophaga sulcirostris]